MLARCERSLFSILLIFLPTQFGKHFWPDFSMIDGIRVDYLSPTLYVTDVLLSLLFLTWIFRTLLLPRKSPHTLLSTKAIVFYSLFVLFLLLSVFFSAQPNNGFYSLIKFLEYSFFAYYVSRTIHSKRYFLHMVFCLGIGASFETLLGVMQYFQQHSLGGIFYYLGERAFSPSTTGIANASLNGSLVLRPYGTFSHPNVLSGFLLISLLLNFFSLPLLQQKQKYFVIGILLLGSVGLVLTMSRIAVVLWLLFLLFFLGGKCYSLSRRFLKNRKINAVHVAVFVLPIVIALCLLFSPIAPRLLQTTLSDESVADRLSLNGSALQIIQSQPILGVGLGNFLPILSEIQSPQVGRYFLQPVHNIYLLIGSEIGILGLVFFLYFLGKTYQRLLSVLQNKTASTFALSITFTASVCLTALLIIGVFDHYLLTLQQGQLLFSLIIGLCWAKIE